MIDVHTHILPAMDDGAKNVEMSLKMLSMEKEQGVDTVVLTPHFYRQREQTDRFLTRRAKSFEILNQAVSDQQGDFPKLVLGAEVLWVPNLAEWPELEQLCIGDSSYMLVELPFHTWDDRMIDQLYSLMNRGITPIFAHLERYLDKQSDEYIQEIIGMGTLVQVSCEPLTHFWGRRATLNMLKRNQAHILASDCHNLTTRAPNLKSGFDAVKRLLGENAAQRLEKNASQILNS